MIYKSSYLGKVYFHPNFRVIMWYLALTFYGLGHTDIQILSPMLEPPKDSAQIILSAKSGNKNQAIQHSAIPYIGAKCGSGYYHCGSILLVWQYPYYYTSEYMQLVFHHHTERGFRFANPLTIRQSLLSFVPPIFQFWGVISASSPPHRPHHW